jgi:hypothetical protein
VEALPERAQELDAALGLVVVARSDGQKQIPLLLVVAVPTLLPLAS